MSAKSSKTSAPVVTFKSKETEAFVAALNSVGEKQDSADVGIFVAASKINAILPEKIHGKDGVMLDKAELLKIGRTEYEMRPYIRAALVPLLGKAPTAEDKKNSTKAAVVAKYNATLRNMERALHVALIVYGSGNVFSQWEGATFSCEAEAIANALAEELPPTKAKNALPKRIIFGLAKPESFATMKFNKKNELIGYTNRKASFATLTKAFPLITKPRPASAGNTGPDAFINASKAMMAILDPNVFPSFDEAQNETLATLAAKINERLGIVTTKGRKASSKADKPKAKAS